MYVSICVPQTMLWLGADCSVLEDCVDLVSKSTDLKHLLQHHKDMGHLEQHGKSLPVTTSYLFHCNF